MKNVMLLAIMAFAFTIIACNESPKATNSSENTSSEATTDAPKDVQAMVYACPMKCEEEKTYAEAGQCPVCEMDLVAVASTETAPADSHEDHDDHEGHDH